MKGRARRIGGGALAQCRAGAPPFLLYSVYGLFKGECAKSPRGRHAVHVVPVVALRGGLGLAIIVDGCVSKVRIGVVDIDDFPPFGCRSRVIYGGKVGATGERPFSHARHAIGDGDAGKAVATVERIVANACHAIGDGDVREIGATGECHIINVCNTVGNGDAFKTGATFERTVVNACYAVGDGNARKGGTTGEHKPANACHAVGDGDARKADATLECIRANTCYAIGDGDAGKPSAIFERRAANARHADNDTEFTPPTSEYSPVGLAVGFFDMPFLNISNLIFTEISTLSRKISIRSTT